MLIGPASLLSTLNAVHQLVGGTSRQKGPAQSFSTMNTHRNPGLNTRTTNPNNQEREEIPTGLEEVNLEDVSIHFLGTYSTHPDWKEIISTCNDYGQTLAHIAVTLGYTQLLQYLFRWKIDLNAVDSTGLSALHYAYLFKQEECARILIDSGVNRFILDDLGRSPADLGPSLEIKLRSVMDMDSDSSAVGAPPIKCDTEMPDDTGKLYATHLLIQQWMRESDDARRDDSPLSKPHSQETSSHPALDSADERVRVVTHDRSSLLGIHTPEEHSTPVVAEEIDLEALIETGAPPHITHPPSPISEVSPETQEANRPSDMGQKPFSRRGRSMNHSPGIPEATSQNLSRKLSGMSWPLNTSSDVPSAEGASVPDTSIPSETSRLQIGSPANPRNEDTNQNTGETFLEEVDPERGPMAGGICIALFGENFPAVPLFVGFGHNWVRAVSCAQYHCQF